jgi:hypothetical protein
MMRDSLGTALLVTLLALAPMPLVAQNGHDGGSDSGSSPAMESEPSTPLPERTRMYRPYRVGERLTYQTRVGFLGEVGEGWLEVARMDTIRGTPVMNLQLGLQASAIFGAFEVDDLLQSWLDPRTMRALRFQKDQKEVNYETHRIYDFFPEEGRWTGVINETRSEDGPLISDTPLDDISFIYFVRSLPLNVGDRYVLDDYFKEDGNPVVIEVLRAETIRVPAGEFQTVVVKPTIKTDGLFGEGGQAEMYFTNDALHLLVQLKARMPVLRTLELRLTSFDLGY